MDAVQQWQESLTAPKPNDHFVLLSSRDEYLTEHAVLYMARGLQRGHAVIVIATPKHHHTFAEELREQGIDFHKAVTEGQLIILEAEMCLAQFMQDGLPNAYWFEQLLKPYIERAMLRYGAITAYGEMVNLLWLQGKRRAAIELEVLWNLLARRYPFSLLCTYELEADAEGVDEIGKKHSHVMYTPRITSLN